MTNTSCTSSTGSIDYSAPGWARYSDGARHRNAVRTLSAPGIFNRRQARINAARILRTEFGYSDKAIMRLVRKATEAAR